jgi:hypothetical protein
MSVQEWVTQNVVQNAEVLIIVVCINQYLNLYEQANLVSGKTGLDINESAKNFAKEQTLHQNIYQLLHLSF